MPKLEQLIEGDEPPCEPCGSCDIPGCKIVFALEGCAECNRCRRVYCSNHELKSFIHPDSSDSSSTDSEDSTSSGLGCVMCCRSKRYVNDRIFDDATIIGKLLSMLEIKRTRLEIEGLLRDEIRGTPLVVTVAKYKKKPKAEQEVEPKTQYSLFDSLRIT